MFKNYIEECLDPTKRNLDRNRGLQINHFTEALTRAADKKSPCEDEKARLAKKFLDSGFAV